MKLLVLFCFLFSTQVLARDGSSGCGPGWYVLQDNSLVSSALRATTNGMLFPSVTIGMTLGTSNCTKHKIVLKEKETIHFATNHYYELRREIGLGGGEFFENYYATIGCQPELESHFAQLIRKEYEKVFQSTEVQPERLVEESYRVILSDPQLTHACSLG